MAVPPDPATGLLPRHNFPFSILKKRISSCVFDITSDHSKFCNLEILISLKNLDFGADRVAIYDSLPMKTSELSRQ